MKQKTMEKINMWATIAIISSILLSLPVLTFLARENSRSWYENRALAPMPTLSTSTIMDGTFFEQLENCLSDRFYKRDSWMAFFTAIQLNAFKKTVVNEVVIADDLLLTPLKPSPPFLEYQVLGNRAANDLTRLNNLVESIGGKFVYIGVPEQYSMLRYQYPYPLFNNDVNLTAIEEIFFDTISEAKINSINMRPIYTNTPDETFLYAKTDHHYRIEGAYLSYFTLCKELHEMGFQFPILTEKDFEYKELPNPFFGSRSRKLYGLSPVEENLKIFELNEPIPFSRVDNGAEVEPTVFKLPGSESEPIDYTLYMGGDIEETIIKTNRPELPNVLLFGNSFTNAMECFLYTSFNETRSLDLRYYEEKGILQYVEEYKPDIVICMRDDILYLYQAGNGIIE